MRRIFRRKSGAAHDGASAAGWKLMSVVSKITGAAGIADVVGVSVRAERRRIEGEWVPERDPLSLLVRMKVSGGAGNSA